MKVNYYGCIINDEEHETKSTYDQYRKGKCSSRIVVCAVMVFFCLNEMSHVTTIPPNATNNTK